MIATPLDARSGRAVRDALIGHGWDDARAADAAAGLLQTVIHLEGLDADAIEALVPFAGTLGLELLTGADWVLLAGSTSRLGALARPWLVPPALAETGQRLQVIVRGKAQPAEVRAMPFVPHRYVRKV